MIIQSPIFGIFSDDTITYSIENEVVHNYLTNVTYDPSDNYVNSNIATYAGATTSYDKDKPVNVTIDIPSSGYLIIENGNSAPSLLYNVSQGTFIIKNLIPNIITSYTLYNSNDKIIKTGLLKPTGQVRMIDTNASNVRDLGGWACDGGTVKYNKLFRGGEISVLDRDILVNQLGVKHELNLRGTEEANRTSSPLGSDIGYTCPENYVWYQITDKETWKEILTCIFENVKYNNPVYFHCSAGADRTGTVASIIEAILGMSQSDIDKEYELTNFHTGVADDNSARRRNETNWIQEMTQINNLIVGTTFRDKILYWVASLGFTADDINNFRAAMIDGTPDTISLSLLNDFTITKSGNNIIFSNNTNSIKESRSYNVDLTANAGYVISNVSITMGGTPVNGFIGNKTNLYKRITNNLTNCSTNNNSYNIINGQGYGAIIIANSGYTLEGASITITEGGVNVTNQYYSDGKIIIPEVTGDIVITVTAVAQGPSYTNVWNLYKVNSRLNSSETDPTANGMYISGFIPIGSTELSGNTIVLRSNKDLFNYSNLSSEGDYLKYYDIAEAGHALGSYSTLSTAAHFTKSYNSTTGIYTLTINKNSYSNVATTANYFRLCAKVSTSTITSDWFDGCILTINEEIV